MLAYTDSDTTVPFTWMESDAKLIENPQMVKLHSFDTKVTTTIHSSSVHWWLHCSMKPNANGAFL